MKTNPSVNLNFVRELSIGQDFVSIKDSDKGRGWVPSESRVGQTSDNGLALLGLPGKIDSTGRPPYAEAGVGVENIFNFFSIDCIWRLNHLQGADQARIVWFECDESTPRPMADHRDLENPVPDMRNRSWLGMIVVNDLKFDSQENEWNGGNIYDPNSGHTFKSVARLVSPQEMVVRGYWGFELFGKSLNFSRVAQKESGI